MVLYNNNNFKKVIIITNYNPFIKVSVDLAEHRSLTYWGDYKLEQIKHLVFGERAKAENSGKNLSEQSGCQPKNLTSIWHRECHQTQATLVEDKCCVNPALATILKFTEVTLSITEFLLKGVKWKSRMSATDGCKLSCNSTYCDNVTVLIYHISPERY